jgi:hypothetical protein
LSRGTPATALLGGTWSGRAGASPIQETLGRAWCGDRTSTGILRTTCISRMSCMFLHPWLCRDIWVPLPELGLRTSHEGCTQEPGAGRAGSLRRAQAAAGLTSRRLAIAQGWWGLWVSQSSGGAMTEGPLGLPRYPPPLMLSLCSGWLLWGQVSGSGGLGLADPRCHVDCISHACRCCVLVHRAYNQFVTDTLTSYMGYLT